MLMMEYHFIMLQANLLGISDGRTSLDPPFTADILSSHMAVAAIPAFGKSVASAQAVLEIFISVPAAKISSLPSVVFPRVGQTVLILIKAASTILKSSEQDSGNRMMLKDREIKDEIRHLAIVEYCDRIINQLRKSMGPKGGRAMKCAMVLSLLKRWFMKNILGEASPTEGIRTFDESRNTVQPTHQSLLLASHAGSSTSHREGRTANRSSYAADSPTDGAHEACSNQLPSFQSRNETHGDQTPLASRVQETDYEMSDHAEFPPIDEAQYNLIETLLGYPGGLPWTLFDDAIAAFDWM
jgi:hypothetical protein